MSGGDAAALAYFRHGCVPSEANHDDTDNERRCVVLPIFLGRFAYDPRSCFPAARRGELSLELEWDVADTGYDDMRFSAEAVELLDAKPSEFEKKVSLALTNGATGDVDIDLPIGNRIRGLLLWGTTDFTGASPSPSWGRISLLQDNSQVMYSSADFEVSQMLHTLSGRQPHTMDAHTHRVDASSASTTEETVGGPLNKGSLLDNYTFLEMDPTRDDMFSLDTSGSSRIHLRPNVETADAVRIIPVEAIKV